eukprot:TRINITY_DN1047_c0_g1_i2.p1 TRINITY_DN1047_c0_g1~~TRINITY_DN1047_c0_g1_i2.p1  ORF type:complete len:142 (-),score=21.36 TRINITY_DN1047_c0_g1_i2:109-534(-)
MYQSTRRGRSSTPQSRRSSARSRSLSENLTIPEMLHVPTDSLCSSEYGSSVEAPTNEFITVDGERELDTSATTTDYEARLRSPTDTSEQPSEIEIKTESFRPQATAPAVIVELDSEIEVRSMSTSTSLPSLELEESKEQSD